MNEYRLGGTPEPEVMFDPGRLPAQLVREARPVYGEPERLEQLRRAAHDGLPVDAVRVLQAELKRFGVRRPSEFVNRIVPRATRRRRERWRGGIPSGHVASRIVLPGDCGVEVFDETEHPDWRTRVRSHEIVRPSTEIGRASC